MEKCCNSLSWKLSFSVYYKSAEDKNNLEESKLSQLWRAVAYSHENLSSLSYQNLNRSAVTTQAELTSWKSVGCVGLESRFSKKDLGV